MSATYENIIEKLKKTDPEFVRAMKVVEDAIGKFHESLGVEYTPPPTVIITEDMTDEEVELQYIECYMRQGATLEEAERLAKERMELAKEIFEELDADDKNNA